ncbi:MAG TPA: aromatic acid exporter family protein [Nocardioidaceae bacterium]|nr:aromatic acid exporter family protein [Nocardioidaceae bacterium]
MAGLLRDPVAWTDGLQMVKTVVAAVVAWVVSAEVFGLPQAFLAPWSALLVVHATVYRSFRKGFQQVVAAVLGVLLAWATGNYLGLNPVALAAMLLAGLLISRHRWLRDEATTVAATALFVLTTGSGTQDHVLVGRLLDTAIGVAVGLVVNVLVWPPLRDLAAARAIDAVARQVGVLLGRIADEFGDDCCEEHVDEWVLGSERLDDDVDNAWALVRQARESGRLNPRKASAVVREPGSFGEILGRTEQAVSEIRSMARTIGHSITATNQWDDEFRDRWTGLLHEIAWALQNRDAPRLAEVRAKLAALASDYSDEELPTLHWPEYGGLILNLRNIASSMDDVADSDPVSTASRGPLGAPAL